MAIWKIYPPPYMRGIQFTSKKLHSKKKGRVNNSPHQWSEEISRVEESISLDSNSSRVKIHYSAN